MTDKKQITWGNRIVGLEWKPANQLLANVKNPRRHPPNQREALRGSLDTLGWYDVVIENQQTGELLDGHARIEEQLTKDENALVPVLVIDMSPEEQDLALAQHDWITTLATYDKDVLDNLLHDLNTDDVRLQGMLSELAEGEGITPPDFMPIDMSEQPRLDQLEPKIVCCPNCNKEFNLRDVES